MYIAHYHRHHDFTYNNTNNTMQHHNRDIPELQRIHPMLEIDDDDHPLIKCSKLISQRKVDMINIDMLMDALKERNAQLKEARKRVKEADDAAFETIEEMENALFDLQTMAADSVAFVRDLADYVMCPGNAKYPQQLVLANHVSEFDLGESLEKIKSGKDDGKDDGKEDAKEDEVKDSQSKVEYSRVSDITKEMKGQMFSDTRVLFSFFDI